MAQESALEDGAERKSPASVNETLRRYDAYPCEALVDVFTCILVEDVRGPGLAFVAVCG